MVSNGKSLVIKINSSNNSYIYPLKSTPLNYLLDKNYLLNQLKKIEPNLIKNNFINFKLINESNRINIYFNKNNLNLAGWKTTDIYQNEVLFEVKNIKKSFEFKINRIWLHTCSLDNEHALKNYLARGMSIFNSKII